MITVWVVERGGSVCLHVVSGRLPLHVTQNNRNNEVINPGGVDLRMAMLPERLKQADERAADAAWSDNIWLDRFLFKSRQP